MPFSPIDISGQRFGKLMALKSTKHRYHGQVVWRCLCDCGVEVTVATGALLCGSKKSCGCLLAEIRSKSSAS